MKWCNIGENPFIGEISSQKKEMRTIARTIVLGDGFNQPESSELQ
ncbi:MAG: hypothetical protein ACTSXK_03755 [Promethearchaeota archaeon]